MKSTPVPWHVGMKPGPIIYGPQGEEIADMRTTMLFPQERNANVKTVITAVNLTKDVRRLVDLILSDKRISKEVEKYEDAKWADINFRDIGLAAAEISGKLSEVGK
jgi:hypothetical protein